MYVILNFGTFYSECWKVNLNWN